MDSADGYSEVYYFTRPVASYIYSALEKVANKMCFP